MNIKPKVGVILTSHVREPSNFSLKLLNNGIKLLESKNIEVYFNNKPLFSAEKIREVLKELKNNVDTFIIIPGNWIEPPDLPSP
ncbi:MAG: hypothetical protein U5N58_08545 [Actinomycetota bacterium]|nr:hypothetical protein [Actinomycetota bacterium]